MSRNHAEDAWRTQWDGESFFGLTVTRDREIITCVIMTSIDDTHTLFDWLKRLMDDRGHYVDLPQVTIAGEFPGVDTESLKHLG